ncbi:unnamed protein product [Dovyalis caffra]|uniref:Uncharacterized protein n=1 Tax=Dovyalis caffra TaxID=77055 RepID=A0AAV1QS09_9ROSI|nr:unnamed protein product [Dovyalis caffra]
MHELETRRSYGYVKARGLMVVWVYESGKPMLGLVDHMRKRNLCYRLGIQLGEEVGVRQGRAIVRAIGAKCVRAIGAKCVRAIDARCARNAVRAARQDWGEVCERVVRWERELGRNEV